MGHSWILQPTSLFAIRQLRNERGILGPRDGSVLLSELLREHIDYNTSELDHLAALQLFAKTVRDNRRLLEKGNMNWKGIAFQLRLMPSAESIHNKLTFRDTAAF